MGGRGGAPWYPGSGRRAASDRRRHHGPGPGRAGPGDRWPIHGVEGVDRRLRPRGVRGSRPGDRLRVPASDGPAWSHRDPTGGPARRMTSAAEAVARAHRTEWGRLVAGLIRVTGDWGLAEDATSEAFASALVRWEADGTPPNPAAWLALTARNRAIDRLRRAATERAKFAEVAMMDESRAGAEEDRLRLIFTCCHPALALPAQVALTLRTVAGLG